MGINDNVKGKDSYMPMEEILGIADSQATAHADLLAKWSEAYERLRTEYNALNAIFMLAPECKMSGAMHHIFECYTETVAGIVGDEEGWLEWYVWENDNGAASMEAKAANWDAVRPIITTDDLLALITNRKETL